MKLIKTASGKETIKITKSDWESIGKTSGWMKQASSENKLEKELIQFLIDNPNPSDEGKGGIHEWAEKNGYNKHKVEETAYSLLSDILSGGRAHDKGVTEKDVDPKELAIGIDVEIEHTGNKLVAKKIAIDHLAEIGNYYSLLKKMEKDAGIKD